MTEIDFARYVDDHTPSVSNYSIDDVIKLLEDESLNLFKRFIGNPLETNNKKYYLMTNMRSCMNPKIENKNAETSLV